MKKNEIKNWIKKHKRGLTIAVVGGAFLVAYGRGVSVGKRSAYGRMDKCINELGDCTFVSIGDGYTVKDLGKVGVDSLKALGCPRSVGEDSKVNAVFYFYDSVK